MDEDDLAERLILMVRDYAGGRASDVARGAETAQLSALLLQKYGYGVADAAALIFGDHRVANRITATVDEEAGAIDPDWRENDRRRWASRPADVTENPGGSN